jgi:hypothetical protein
MSRSFVLPRRDDQPRHQRPLAGAGVRTFVAVSLVLVAVSACGNAISYPDKVGQVGITVDQAGRPVIAVMTCSKATPVIQMHEGRKPSDPDTKENVKRGSWQARTAFAGVRNLAPTATDDTWVTASGAGSLESDRMFLVTGGIAEKKNTTMGGVSFRLSDLDRLSPDQVQVDTGVQSLSAFSAYHCPENQ